MSENILTIEDAARSLEDVVERVHTSGEATLLVKSGQPLARIVPVSAVEPERADLIAFLRQWRIDHPEADEQFAAAIEESRQAIGPPHDPW